VSAPLLYDAELEGAVLGAMLHSPELCRLALDKLSPSDFGSPDARALFEVVAKVGEGDWTRVVHQATQMGRELRPYMASLAGSGTNNPKLVDDMLTLRRRRSLEDVSELARKAMEMGDPDQAMPLLRALVQEEPSKNGWKRFSAKELLTAEFEPIRWVVPSLLAEGLCVFGGRPKARKSWMALQLAIAKAAGGVFLGQRLQPGPVLYLALEDGARRLQDRLHDLECPTNVDGLTFMCGMPPIGKGGLEYVTALMDETEAEVVVIDTLSRAMDRGVGQGADQDRNADMTAVLNPFQRLALERGIGLMVIDHLKKRGEGLEVKDPVEGILGSTAKTGVADTIWGLYRRRGETVGTLSVIGRDVEERDLEIRWDPTPAAWQLVGDLERTQHTEAEQRYLAVVARLGGEHVPSEAIAAELDVTLQAAGQMLRKLTKRGDLVSLRRTGPKGGHFNAFTLVRPASRARVRVDKGVDVLSVGLPTEEAWWPGEGY
jgi:hypothetical protein